MIKLECVQINPREGVAESAFIYVSNFIWHCVSSSIMKKTWGYDVAWHPIVINVWEHLLND